MASIYRVGIIGCGWIAAQAPDSHLRAYQDCSRTNLIATCDINGGWDYTDYNEMVRECKLDIVSVCTPVETHCKIVCDIAPYVEAIYCEKPMASTLGECSQMIEACVESGTILQINHQRRFINPKFRFSRDLIDTGTHAFDLIKQYFGTIISLSRERAITDWGYTIELEYIPSQEHIFELDCTRSKEPMIKAGVEHLVNYLDQGMSPIRDGYAGKEALKWALKYKELIETI